MSRENEEYDSKPKSKGIAKQLLKYTSVFKIVNLAPKSVKFLIINY